MKRSLYRGLVRLQSYVEPAMAERVDQYCAATGLSESALIKSSLTKCLDGTNDATLLLRRMDRLGRARERDHRDLYLRPSPSSSDCGWRTRRACPKTPNER